MIILSLDNWFKGKSTGNIRKHQAFPMKFTPALRLCAMKLGAPKPLSPRAGKIDILSGNWWSGELI